MKSFILSFFLLCALFANAQDQSNNNNTKPPTIFKYVEKMPKPGYDLNQYLSENLHYPIDARRAGIGGKVIIKFVVTESGAIEDVTVLKTIGGGCDEEAERVIKNMPPWSPGTQDGKPVKVYFTQPITFTLQDDTSPPPPPSPPPPGDIMHQNDTAKKPKIYTYVEGMPSPGYDLGKYLQNNLHYPRESRKARITGKVIVKFVVSETGAIENVTVLKGIGAGCDEEAARVIREMPTWKPGTQNGKPVKVYFTQPINFNLD